MKMFLEAEVDYFRVYSDTSNYIGFLVKYGGVWKFYPERRVQDLDEGIISGVDEILGILNSEK